MLKPGRPSVSYSRFVEVWEQLLGEEQASISQAQKLLGARKSTITKFRDDYERAQTSKQVAMLNSIQLTEAVQQALAEIKVKEVLVLEAALEQLQARFNALVAALQGAEEKLAATKVMLDEQKVNFDVEKLDWERKLAAAQALTAESKQQEQQWVAKYESLHEQYMQAKQEAAVAKKEVEMLREQGNNQVAKTSP